MKENENLPTGQNLECCAVLYLVTQSCPTLCDPMDRSLPGSSVHGIVQARILEWVAMPSCRGSSQPRIEPRSPALHLSHEGSPNCSYGLDYKKCLELSNYIAYEAMANIGGEVKEIKRRMKKEEVKCIINMCLDVTLFAST